MSSAASGVPSCHCTPSRRVNVHSEKSALFSQLVAIAGQTAYTSSRHGRTKLPLPQTGAPIWFRSYQMVVAIMSKFAGGSRRPANLPMPPTLSDTDGVGVAVGSGAAGSGVVPGAEVAAGAGGEVGVAVGASSLHATTPRVAANTTTKAASFQLRRPIIERSDVCMISSRRRNCELEGVQGAGVAVQDLVDRGCRRFAALLQHFQGFQL